MSLKITPQPDGSIIVSCGSDKVTIPAASAHAAAAPPIEPIFPKPGTVVAQWGPAPDNALLLGDADLSDIISGLDPGRESLALEVSVSRPEGVDIEALLSLTRQQLDRDVPIDLYFKMPDD